MDATKNDRTHFIVNGTRYDVPDDDDVTLGDAEEWEAIAGVPFGARVSSARSTIAWLYLAMRHGGAKVTLDEIRKLKHNDFDIVEAKVKPDPPAQPLPAEQNGNDGQRDSEAILATGGSQPSSTSTDSSPGT